MNFICKRCDKDYKKRSRLIEHLQKKNSCEVVKQDISCRNLLIEMGVDPDEKYECNFCSRVLDNKAYYRYHQSMCSKAFEKKK